MFLLSRARGEMDITAVFGTAVLGSSPGGRTRRKQTALLLSGVEGRRHAAGQSRRGCDL